MFHRQIGQFTKTPRSCNDKSKKQKQAGPGTGMYTTFYPHVDQDLQCKPVQKERKKK